jgi:hypothetical protein
MIKLVTKEQKPPRKKEEDKKSCDEANLLAFKADL